MRILKWFQQRDAEMSVRVGKARNNTVRLTGAACTGRHPFSPVRTLFIPLEWLQQNSVR